MSPLEVRCEVLKALRFAYSVEAEQCAHYPFNNDMQIRADVLRGTVENIDLEIASVTRNMIPDEE